MAEGETLKGESFMANEALTPNEVVEKWNSLSPRERDAWVAQCIGAKVRWEKWPDSDKYDDWEPWTGEPPPVTGGPIECSKDDKGAFPVEVIEKGPRDLPRYTESIEAAWEVRDYILDNFGGVTIERFCDVYPEYCGIYHSKDKRTRVWATTTPEAICLALIFAVECGGGISYHPIGGFR